MPSLRDLIVGRRDFPRDPLPQAHFLEHHWVHPKLSWDAGTALLRAAFPKDARPERPKEWYSVLRGTHWPGEIPPGNGPFYVPEWAWEGVDEESGKLMAATLKRAGFRRVIAHVVYLPSTRDYLVAAMRVVGKNPWTANPVTARLYLYPTLMNLSRRPLRRFTSKQWAL